MGACLSCFKSAENRKGTDTTSSLGQRQSVVGSEASLNVTGDGRRRKFKILRKEKLKWNGSQASGGSSSSVADGSDQGTVDETRYVTVAFSPIAPHPTCP